MPHLPPAALPKASPLLRLVGAVAFAVVAAGASACSGAEVATQVPPIEPGEADGPVALEDVAVLLPLPTRASPELIWPASAEVDPGRALLPRPLAARFPLLQEDPSATYESLTVVALRLDPCAPSRASAVPTRGCAPEVRFVLQPLVSSGDGEPAVHDAAVHVSYRVGIEAFLGLLNATRAARLVPVGARLGVHTAFGAGRDAGAFFATLRAKASEVVATGTLSRATFMTLRSRGNEWQFGGVDVTPEAPLGVPMRIVGATATLQSLVLLETDRTFAKALFPRPADALLSPLLSDRAMRAASKDELAAALASANLTNNPDARTIEDTDCASCHTAHSSSAWAARELGVATGDGRYVAPVFDLTPLTLAPNDTGVLRAFGYMDRAPVVSPRTVHEAAKAARQCNWILQQ